MMGFIKSYFNKYRNLPILIGIRNQKGYSLVELMVALFMGVIILSMVVSIYRKMSAQSVNMAQDLDLNALKWTIRDRLDCYKTLGITDLNNQYRPCQNTAYTLRDRLNGNISDQLKTQKNWDFQIRCETKNKFSSLIIYVKKKTAYLDVKKNTSEKSTWTDLFGGNSTFCRNFLTKDPLRDFNPYENPCKGNAKYPILTRNHNNRALCCTMAKTSDVISYGSYKATIQFCPGGTTAAQGQRGTHSMVLAGVSCASAVTRSRQVVKDTWTGAGGGMFVGKAQAGGLPCPFGVCPPHVHPFNGQIKDMTTMGPLKLSVDNTYEGKEVPIGGFISRMGLSGGDPVVNHRNLQHAAMGLCFQHDWGQITDKNNLGQALHVAKPISLCCPNIND